MCYFTNFTFNIQQALQNIKKLGVTKKKKKKST
jgi:hypothetical protein